MDASRIRGIIAILLSYAGKLAASIQSHLAAALLGSAVLAFWGSAFYNSTDEVNAA